MSQDRDSFLAELSQCELPNRISGDRLSETIDLWREGVITNWEYLMQLNKLAGRSYNDLMQYPVFPFVLSDYVSTVLDLTDAGSFRYTCTCPLKTPSFKPCTVLYVFFLFCRDFARPMAIQNPANEQHYIKYYNVSSVIYDNMINI